MNVHDAIRQLSALPENMEIMDEYAENILLGFHLSSYEGEHGDVKYVTANFVEVIG